MRITQPLHLLGVHHQCPPRDMSEPVHTAPRANRHRQYNIAQPNPQTEAIRKMKALAKTTTAGRIVALDPWQRTRAMVDQIRPSQPRVTQSSMAYQVNKRHYCSTNSHSSIVKSRSGIMLQPRGKLKLSTPKAPSTSCKQRSRV